MPNYDLGIAHGRIKIDSDTRGATDAERHMRKLEAESKTLSKEFRSLQDVMNRVEASNVALARSMDRASSKFNGFKKDVISASNSLKKLSNSGANAKVKFDEVNRSVGILERSLKSLTFKIVSTSLALKNLSDSASVFRKITTVTNGFGLSMANARRHALNLGLAITGVNREMKNAPVWHKNMMKFAGSVGTAVAAVKFLSKFQLSKNLFASAGFALSGFFDHRNLIRVAKGLREIHSISGQLSKSLTTLGIGVAAVRAGVTQLGNSFQFLRKIPLPILAAVVSSFQILPELMGSTARGLRIISNTLVGTTGALRQLSGTFLALPGIISMAGALFATLKTVFGGLGDQFKDIFDDDPEKAAEAFSKLDNSLKPLGKSLIGLVKNFKEVQKVLRTEAFSGLPEQIDRVTKQYLPKLQSGMLDVVKSTKGIFNSIFDSLIRPESQGVIIGVFQRLSQVMKSFTPAIKPMMDGFMRLTDISTRFTSGVLNRMSGGFTEMMNKFSTWAASGKALDQMINSFVGLRKSVIGLKDLWMGLYNSLALFSTNSGVKGIDAFASAMKRFNEGVQKSSLTGRMAQFRDFMNSFKNQSFDKIKSSFSNFMRLMDELLPTLINIGSAINGPLNSAMSTAISIFNAFLNVVQALHLDDLLGEIIGLAAAFKLIMAAGRPLAGLGLIFGGITTAISGFKKTMSVASVGLTQFIAASRTIEPQLTGVARGVNKVTRGGALVSRVFTGVGAALAGFASGPIGIATVASLALFEAWRGGSDEIRALQETIDVAGQHAIEFGSNLSKAFTQDGGVSGRDVFSSVSQGVTQMMTDLQDQSEKAPGIMAHIADSFSSKTRDGSIWGRLGFSDSDELNSIEKASQDAERARNKFKDLGVTTDDLSRIIMSSDQEFKKWSDSVRNSGENGNEAANAIQRQRQVYQQIKQDFIDIGPAGATLAKGIEMISGAAGDATTKLQALRLILQGLGILKTTSYEAAAQYAETVQSLGEKAREAASNVTDLGETIDRATGDINTNSAAGRALLSVLEPVADAFLNTATAGNDIDGAFNDIRNQMQGVADAFGIPIESVNKFIQQLGVVPDIVKVSVQLDGTDPLTQQLGQLFIAIQSMANNAIGIPLKLTGADTPDAAKSISDQINSIIGNVTQSDGTKIQIKPDISPEAMAAVIAKLQKGLNEKGIDTSGGQGSALVPQPQPQAKPPVFGPPVPQTPGAPLPPVQPAPTPQPAPQAPIPTINSEEIAQQTEKVKAAQGALEEASGKWKEYAEAIKTSMADGLAAIQQFTGTAISVLSTAASAAKASGALFTANYALGILENIGLVEQAANSVAQAAKDRGHQSPPKKGPLSEHGDAVLYAGQMFSKTYARGIAQYGGMVGSAASTIAGFAAGGLNSGGPGGGYFGLNSGGLSGGMDQILDRSSRLVQFLSNFAGVIQQIGQTFFQAMSFFADPEGKGTFFGQHKGFIRDPKVTDKMLADKRADEDYAKTHDGNIPNEVAKEEKANAKGRPLSAKQTLAANNPTQRQIAQTIYNRAIDQGYSNSDSLAIVAAAMGQSGLSTDKGIFGVPTPGIKGSQAVSEQVTTFLQQMYQAQAGNVYARIREVGRMGDAGFENIRSNEPNARILIAPGDTDTAFTTTTRGTEGNRRNRKNLPETDALGNQITSGENIRSDIQILGGNIDVSEDIRQAMEIGNSPLSSHEDTVKSLNKIQAAIDQQTALDTPASRATAGGLESAKSQIMSSKGYAEDQDPVSKMSSAFTSVGNIAQNAFGTIQAAINAVGGAKTIGDQLVRGLSSTDDIVNVVTQVQKFIDLGAKIASTVASVADVVGQAAASSQFSAPAQAVSAISSIVASALQGVNAAIDLGKEAWEIFGSYFGQFLGMLAGAGNQIEGNVRYLLDSKVGQLLAYSADNPNNKVAHAIPGVKPSLGPDNGNLIGQINMYGGPGSDPRDDTRNMLYQVQAAQLQGALSA